MEDVSVVDVSLEQWKSTVDINMTSPFLVVREYLKQLAQATEAQRERASVVLVGSTAGKFGERGHADYAATKSGEFPVDILIIEQCQYSPYWQP